MSMVLQYLQHQVVMQVRQVLQYLQVVILFLDFHLQVQPLVLAVELERIYL